MATNPSMQTNQGEGEGSYARNSNFQKAEQDRMMPIIKEALIGLWNSTNAPSSMVIADLGCSSGPNALALVSTAVDAIFHHCARNQQAPPELHVWLNDLPDNDFNNVAKSLITFQQSTQYSGMVLTGIVPGSFYKRLFSSNSIDLVVSSNSLHWLSEAPQDLKRNGIPMYHNDESLREAMRPLVIQAYARQFKKDFTLFLNLRAQELVPGGRMVISVLGSRASTCIQPWDIITFPLNDMASRGLISKEMFDSFYVPMHGPSDIELREIIEDEGSFNIDKVQVHERMHGMDKSLITPKMTAHSMRAIFEPMILHHFGRSGEIMDEFVRTLEQHLVPGSPQHAALLGDRVFVCVSLTRF